MFLLVLGGSPFFCSGSEPSPSSPILPDALITPGDVLTTDSSIVCVRGYSKSVRNVPASIKAAAYSRYGIQTHSNGEYEVDHLISLELGGSNAIENLWPESYLTQPLNAHLKDKLENRLHSLVCSGSLPLVQAQKEIADNWIAAYEKYVGQLDSHTDSEGHARQHDAEKSSDQVLAEPETKLGMACSEDSPIKVSKRGVIHRPSDPNYTRTKETHCYATVADAIDAGFHLPKR